MSVSTELPKSVYIKLNKMSALSFTAAWISRCSQILSFFHLQWNIIF